MKIRQPTRAEFANGLREMADWLEAHPQVPVPYTVNANYHIYNWNENGQDYEKDLDIRRKATHLSGNWNTELIGDMAYYTREFSGNVDFCVMTSRATVCKRVKVGTREVPAREARTEDVYEWECGPNAAETSASESM